VSEQLGASRSRLSPEIAQLIKQAVVREADAPLSTGGRRGAWLYLGGADFGAFCGVDIDADRVAIALLYFDGTVVSQASFVINQESQPIETMREICDLLAAKLRDTGLTARSVGVAIAADADYRGRIYDIPPTLPRWRDIEVGGFFSERLGVPTYVDNDVNILAEAEGMHGTVASRYENYAVVKISSGVGCGLISNGRLVRGVDGHAGDIGHVCIDPANDSPCACGNAGCLEAVVSSPALIRQALEIARQGRSNVLTQLMTDGTLTHDSISSAAKHGDPETVMLLRNAGRHVGYALAGLVAIFNPAAIFISTGIAGAEDIVLSAIRERVYERARPAATRRLKILNSGFLNGDGALAAAIFASGRLVAAPGIH
jgi:predicted NBD/HSP70 family sugar kinase